MTKDIRETGTLVTLRPWKYHRDKNTGMSYSGAMGDNPKSKRYKLASPPFRISAADWARDESLPPAERSYVRAE